MKRAIFAIILIVAIAMCVLWMRGRNGTAKPTEEKAEPSRISHDEKGHVIIKMDHQTQTNIGLVVAKAAAAKLRPELKGYGRVLDPAPLATLMAELASAKAAYSASSNDLARLKLLAGQANASARALQTAEAAALRDQIAVQSAKEHLMLSWGKGVADQKDLPAFVQSLTSQNAVLVRIDLPAGQTLKSPPASARISTLSGAFAEAEFLGVASNVDPQTLGRGTIFLIEPNALRLLPGEAVTGYLTLPGEPLLGVIIPSPAIVRTEGAGWVFIPNGGGDAFTRTQVSLDRPTDAGWFLTQGVTTNDSVVVSGAQILLSEELKASLKSD